MTVEIKGLQDVLRKMRNVSDKVQKEAVSKALVKAGSIIRDEAKKRAYTAPADYEVYYKGEKRTLSPGYVGDSIVLVKMDDNELRGLRNGYLVTLGKGPKDIKGVAKKMGSLLEYSSNTKTGMPMPFMGPAYDAKNEEAFAAAKNILMREIGKIWT